MASLVAAVAAFGIVLIYAGATAPTAAYRSRWISSLDDLAQEAGFKQLSGPGLAALCAGTWIVSFVVVAGVTTSIVVAGAISLILGWLPLSIASARRKARRKRHREAWPDAIAGLIASVRAGVSLPESCLMMLERGPRELFDGWAAFATSYRASGSFRSGLERLRDALADPIADRVVAALALAHEVGGTDLVRVLRTLGDFVREDVRVRKEIEARWSWTVTAARVAAAAPWIVLLMMSTRPEGAAAYNSATGAVVVAAGAGATIIGYRLMLRAARLPDDKRLAR
jgi:tight adherence protein B